MTKTSAKKTANASIAQAQYKAMIAVAKKAKTWSDTSYKKATTNSTRCLLSATQSHLQHVRKALL